jgi:hypothetical protein
MSWNRKLWASDIPRDPTQRKPNHYAEMLSIAWKNRDQLPYAWRILNHVVCDGCALGTAGLKDWTMNGGHLCMVRLELMRLNTAPALDPKRLSNVAALTGLSADAGDFACVRVFTVSFPESVSIPVVPTVQMAWQLTRSPFQTH